MRKGSEILKSMFRSAALILITLSLLLAGYCAGFADDSIGTTFLFPTDTPLTTEEPEKLKTPVPKETPVLTETSSFTETPSLTETPEPTPRPVQTEAPLITATPKPAVSEDPEDFVPPSPEPPEPAKQGHPTLGPTEMPDRTVIDHVNYPKELRNFRFRRDAKLLEIWFPNIRDADAAILTFDGQVYMIDCGDEKSARRTTVLLQQLGIDKIDILFTSHLHHDHINGLALTDDVARVGEVKTCFETGATESGELLEQVAADRNIPISMYKSGDWFTMGEKGEVTLLFLRNYDPVMDMNNQSAVTVVRYKDRSILFTADMEKNGQAQMLKHVDPALLKCDILKYPHHAKSALYPEFYQAVDPKLAVVTSVEGRRDVGQSFLVANRIPAAYTSVKGQFLHLATDGEYWLAEYVSSNGK